MRHSFLKALSIFYAKENCAPVTVLGTVSADVQRPPLHLPHQPLLCPLQPRQVV
jgi:hypothetical protein